MRRTQRATGFAAAALGVLLPAACGKGPDTAPAGSSGNAVGGR